MAGRFEWAVVVTGLVGLGGCGAPPAEAKDPSVDAMVESPPNKTHPNGPATSTATAPKPPAENGPLLTTTSGGRVRLVGGPVVLRDPNAPDPTGPTQLDVRFTETAVVLGETSTSLDLPADELGTALREQLRPQRDALVAKGELPYYSVSIEDTTKLGPLKIALRAMAFAGWADARLTMGERSVELRIVVPGTPAPVINVPTPLAWSSESLVVQVSADRTVLWNVPKTFTADAAPGTANDPNATAPTADSPKPLLLTELPSTIAATKVKAAVKRACQSVACTPIALAVTDLDNFARVRVLLAALAEQQPPGKALYVDFRTNEPNDRPEQLTLSERVGLARVVRVNNTGKSGTLPMGVLQQVIQSNYATLRQCYNEGLVRNPKLSGKVVIRFVIGTDGKVTSTREISNQLPDARTTECLIRVFEGLQFPTPDGGPMNVVLPLNFVTKQGPKH